MLVARLTKKLESCLTTNQAKQIHAQIVVHGLNQLEPILVRQILLSACSYSRSAAQYVQNILLHLQNPNAYLWGCAVRYLSQQGQFKESLLLYVQMHRQGLCPSTYSVSSALRACARILYKMGGMLIHSQTCKYGFSSCVYVQTALLGFYSKLGEMDTALKFFDEMVEKNVVSWNSVICGYLKLGKLLDAQHVFDKMPMKDVVSWNSMLSGYASIGDMDRAFHLFQQMTERNLASWNAMIGGYVNSGNIESARRLFDTMPKRNSITWITMIGGYSKCGDVESARKIFTQINDKDLLSYNAMISCFTQNNQPMDALQLFNEMLTATNNVQPDEMTLVSVISSCSQLGDLRFGSWVEPYIRRAGIKLDDHLITALIDLYAKCGDIEKAYEFFHSLNKKDVVSYGVIILGCGINGKVVDAVKLFDEMKSAQIRPNLVTFTGLLTAFNHAGMVEEGYQCFNSMKDYKLEPLFDHYAIMGDLLGRAGRLMEAYDVIKSMPMEGRVEVWGGLLLACEVHRNVELGEVVARRCFELEPEASAYYSLLANIYASVGRWKDAAKLRKTVNDKKLAKLPGCSWTELH